jgi:MoaD family protein
LIRKEGPVVKVRLLTHLGRAVGVQETGVEADTVGRLLAALSKQYGKPFDAQIKSCKVLVNGTNVAFLKGTGTKLADGDEVVLMPPMAGG